MQEVLLVKFHWKEFTGKTHNISEYLNFEFYEKVRYKENYGLSKTIPGHWIGVLHRTVTIMYYYILTQAVSVVSRSTVQRVTNFEPQETTVKDTFIKYDVEIHQSLKADDRGYDGEIENLLIETT